MNCEKIGKFIAEKRKKLNYTQKELADQLGLTDRAISRWERGVGCPDIGYLEELANILNVSVLEILHGEEIFDETMQNQTVVKMMQDNRKKMNRLKIGFLVVLHFLLVVFVMTILFITNIGYKEDNSMYQYIKITSPSMKPQLNIGDVVKIERVKANQDLYVGNMITFYLHNTDTEDSLVTHRIVKKYKDSDSGKIYYVTKGDFNESNDPYDITLEDIVGKVTKKVRLSWLLDNHWILWTIMVFVYTVMIVDGCMIVIFIKSRCVK